MDDTTSKFYRDNAEALAGRYESVPSSIARYFGAAFPSESTVLDIGAGSGRDLALLLKSGYDAYGVEPSESLCAHAVRIHPELAHRLTTGGLPDIGQPFGKSFGGLLCSAVLMHVPESELFDTAFSLRRLLKPHGRLLISLPLVRGDVGTDERDRDGRLFKTYTPEYLQLLLERIGFQQIGRWDTADALNRPEITWFTLLFELRSAGTLRAVDQIEGILNRDKKVATYKLALFRALGELATQEPRCVSWRKDGKVGVPIGRIAEKWLGYYWPIFASERYVPQSQAEGAGSDKPLLFRSAVQALMAPYRHSGEHGGLTAWQLDVLGGRLSQGSASNMRHALAAICRAIKQGPVTFAGGALETGRVFDFDRATSEILMAADIWREVSLLGHWIVDAVIVRWAELCERFGRRQGVRSGDVLPLLLARPEAERATVLAREVFLKEGVNRCTWSGRPIGGDMCIDHAIPFALWGSNSLWNLMPTDPRVNNEKSDKLPARELLAECRASIVGNWQLLREAMPTAFDQQALHLLGRPLGGSLRWDEDLFTRLRDAIEITALQRGVERWIPRERRAVAS
jgi:SAM-dependent methyltransferase